MTVVAAIVGSAFESGLAGFTLEPEVIETAFGEFEFYRVKEVTDREAWVIYRHGLPHQFLPNQINYRAMIAGLKEIGCEALLTTTSVGVMDELVPLYLPVFVDDLMMLENRLPDGTACTMFLDPHPRQGHLVIKEGLFSKALTDQVRGLAKQVGTPATDDVTFVYIGGPRTKTKAENKWLASQGAQVNSMTFAPEVVLANELEIPVCGIAVGHKYSVHDIAQPEDGASVTESLEFSRRATERVVQAFLRNGESVPFANHIYRFVERGLTLE